MSEDQNLWAVDELQADATNSLELAQLAAEENDAIRVGAINYFCWKTWNSEVNANNCFLDINACVGGTESHDWA